MTTWYKAGVDAHAKHQWLELACKGMKFSQVGAASAGKTNAMAEYVNKCADQQAINDARRFVRGELDTLEKSDVARLLAIITAKTPTAYDSAR